MFHAQPRAGGCAARSDEQEVAAVQTAQGHVLQHDGVVRIKGDDRIIALLLAESEDGLEVGVGQQRAIELDVIAVLEVGDDVVPEAGCEHEHIGVVAAGKRVIAGTAVQPVIALAAGKRVIAAPAVQPVIAIAARHGVVAVAAFEVIIPVPAGHGVVAERSGEVVVSIATAKGPASLGDVRHGDINRLRAGVTQYVSCRHDHIVDIVVGGILRRFKVWRG